MVSGAPTDGLGSSSSGADAGFGGSGEFAASDAAGSCHASAALTYAPTPYRAASAPSGACIGGDAGPDAGSLMDAFFDACLGTDKNSAACDAFNDNPSNAACGACILTAYDADHPGPILNYGEYVGGNVAGCIERTAPSDISCARAVQALTDCELEACQANCPVTDMTSLAALQTCSAAADTNGCSTYFAVATSCQSEEEDAGLARPCRNAGFRAFYDAVVPYFCAVAAGDASVPLDAAAGDAVAPLADGGEHPAALAPRDAGSD
jgi:hypothetical protein